MLILDNDDGQQAVKRLAVSCCHGRCAIDRIEDICCRTRDCMTKCYPGLRLEVRNVEKLAQLAKLLYSTQLGTRSPETSTLESTAATAAASTVTLATRHRRDMNFNDQEDEADDEENDIEHTN